MTTGRDAIGIRRPNDGELQVLADLHNAAAIADGTSQRETADGLRHAQAFHLPIRPDDVIAVATRGSVVVGYHQLRCFREPPGLEIYSHRGFVAPSERHRGVGAALFAHAEARLNTLAKTRPAGPKVLSSWCYKSETGAVDLLRTNAYQVQRTMIEMSHTDLRAVRMRPLPPGIKIRAVRPAHLRPIWNAYLDAAADDLGAVADSPGAFEHWASAPDFDPDLWQIAWSGDEVVGMVLNSYAADDSALTEDVFVRRPWRRTGIAAALLTRSIAMFRDAGNAAVRLDVNEANPSCAPVLYASLGYRETRRLSVYRKPLPARATSVS